MGKSEIDFFEAHMLRLIVLSSFLPLLAACNIWSGFGKDLQDLGKSIDDRAKESPSTDK
jgi:predicted small secreted protein